MQLLTRGMQDYFFQMSNVLTLFQLALYGVTYTLRFHTFAIVAEEKSKLDDPEFWSKVRNLASDDIEKQTEIYETFYWLNNGQLH